jgi:hypothetical protein
MERGRGRGRGKEKAKAGTLGRGGGTPSPLAALFEFVGLLQRVRTCSFPFALALACPHLLSSASAARPSPSTSLTGSRRPYAVRTCSPASVARPPGYVPASSRSVPRHSVLLWVLYAAHTSTCVYSEILYASWLLPCCLSEYCMPRALLLI